MFIQTEATPNPATLKFLPGRKLPCLSPLSFLTAMKQRVRTSRGAVPGRRRERVMFGSDFISVTKDAGEWQHIKPAVLGAIMEHFMSGWPLLAGDADASDEAADEFYQPEHLEIVETIKDLLEVADLTGGSWRWWGYHFSRLPRRRRFSFHERRLFRLSIVDRDAQARYREPASSLRTGSRSRRTDVTGRRERPGKTCSFWQIDTALGAVAACTC